MKTTLTTKTPPSLRRTSLVICAVGAFFAANALAAGPALSEAQAAYKRDRAACMSGQSHQDRATCLREAGAALSEARRNGLTTTSDSQFVQNRLDRCVPLPAADQEDCVRRMSGEGIVRGSVEEGGIYRELSRTVPSKQVP